MSNHLKGFSKNIQFGSYEKLLNELLYDYCQSQNDLIFPVKDDVFCDNRLEELLKFQEYFKNRVKISLADKHSKYTVSIINQKNVYKSVLKAYTEIELAKEQIEIWKVKINSGRYGDLKTSDNSMDLFYLFKYKMYLLYLKWSARLLKDVYLFLDKNFHEELKEVIKINGGDSESKFVDSEISKSGLLNTKQAMAYYGVARGTLDNWAKNPENPLQKKSIGRRNYFNKNEFLSKRGD